MQLLCSQRLNTLIGPCQVASLGSATTTSTFGEDLGYLLLVVRGVWLGWLLPAHALCTLVEDPIT